MAMNTLKQGDTQHDGKMATVYEVSYSLSILKRQLERGRDVLLRCQMSHVYTIIFLIIFIFLLEIFLCTLTVYEVSYFLETLSTIVYPF